jgi:hypothetical protein
MPLIVVCLPFLCPPWRSQINCDVDMGAEAVGVHVLRNHSTFIASALRQ